MYRKGVISVAAREVTAVPPIVSPNYERELSISAKIKTHRSGIDCAPNCLQCLADAGEPECVAKVPKIEASEQP